MIQAQRDTYGDALNTPHPYMWAVKPHYYGRSFYNYPYTFGLLFGLGLYAQYEQARAQGRKPTSRPATTPCWPPPGRPPRWTSPRASASTCTPRTSGKAA